MRSCSRRFIGAEAVHESVVMRARDGRGSWVVAWRVVGVALMAAACGGDVERSNRRDSAGIEIVESAPESPRVADAWTIDAEPLLAIGEDSAQSAPQFSRVLGLLRFADGRIVVSDAAARQLYFFDSAGRLVKTAGGPGQGPGEFGYSVLRVWPAPSGEIVVADEGALRMNVFSDTGAFIRTSRFAPLDDIPRIAPVGVFADGTVLASGLVGPSMQPPRRAGETVRRDAVYLRYSPSGELLGRILRVSLRPDFVDEYMGGVAHTAVPLTPVPLVAVRGDRVIVYRGPEGQLEEWTQSGKLARLIRWTGAAPRRVTDVWDRYKVAYLQNPGLTPLGRQFAAHFISLDLPLPELVPSTERLIVDGEGGVWAQRYRLPWETSFVWDVISPDGDFVGTVTTPPDLTIYQIGSDFVLGVHRDSIGVQSVRLHALRRPGATSIRDPGNDN